MLLLLLLSIASVNAQVTIGSTNDPHAGAVLDLQSTSKGLLLPNVSLSNVSTLTVISSPTSAQKTSAKGMMVYNTNANVTGGNGSGVYVWDGAKWCLVSGSTTPATVYVTGVSLNKSTTSLTVGNSETLIATVSPTDATNKNVTWSSNNSSVAIVSNGTITAIATGSATITATTVDGSKTASCSVTVTAATNEDGSITMHIGNNDYKTYVYNTDGGNGRVWMVQNSREGMSNTAAGTNGYYYTWQQAIQEDNACPEGWSLPSQTEYAALLTFVNADKSGVGKWWCQDMFGAYAGYSFNNGIHNLGQYGYWWTSTAEKQYFVNYILGGMGRQAGELNGPYVHNQEVSYSVRCIKK